jgi:hypothetical protein
MKFRLGLLLLLTLSGGWLRYQNLNFGLPELYRPDEEYLVSRAIAFEDDLNPHFAVYPALQMYVQAAALHTRSWWNNDTRPLSEQLAEEGIHTAHLSGREVAAGFGTLTIPAIYWAASATYGPVAALASAAGLTVATIHVRESKYATTDAAATFWLTLAIGAMLRILSDGRLRYSVLAGALTGLAIATKYPSGALLAGLAFAHVGARWREGRSLWRTFRDIRPWLTLYAACAVTFLGTPYTFIDWQETVRGFEYQSGFVANGVGNPYSSWGWEWFLTRVLPDSLGPELALVLILATLWVLLRPQLGTWSLLIFLAIALVGITQSRYTFYRYVMIPLPVLLLFFGILMADLRRGLLRLLPRPWPAFATGLFVVVLLVPCLIRDYKLNRLLGRRDSREMARQWIDKNIGPRETIAATDHGTPYGKPQLKGRPRFAALASPAELRQNRTRWILSDSDILPFYSKGPTPTEAGWLETKAILRFEVDPRKPDTPPPLFDEADAFYVPLRHASSIKRPGPRIRIWELPPE